MAEGGAPADQQSRHVFQANNHHLRNATHSADFNVYSHAVVHAIHDVSARVEQILRNATRRLHLSFCPVHIDVSLIQNCLWSIARASTCGSMEEGDNLGPDAHIEEAVVLVLLACMLVYVTYNCVKFATGGYRLVREEDIDEAVEHDD